MSLLTLEAKLERHEPTTPWGFRMIGGKDFSSPITIARVSPGSLAAKCGLLQGDVILKIGNKSSEALTHKAAQDAIIQYGNKLNFLLQRYDHHQAGAPSPDKLSTTSVTTYRSPAGSKTNVGSQNYNKIPQPFGSTVNKPLTTPHTPVDDNISSQTKTINLYRDGDPSHDKFPTPSVTTYKSPASQPNDGNQSHNKNPKPIGYKASKPSSMPYSPVVDNVSLQTQNINLNSVGTGGRGSGQGARGPQSPQTPKQAVPKVTHAQYNSPIGLYSASNIADSYSAQTAGMHRQISDGGAGKLGSGHGVRGPQSPQSPKQAVPKVVHAQYNSPIGLYSAGNIADSYSSQTAGIQRQISGAPDDSAYVPDYSKYVDIEKPAGPQSHQSRSMKLLQDTLDKGEEPGSAPWKSS